jgi:hypothetical protein
MLKNKPFFLTQISMAILLMALFSFKYTTAQIVADEAPKDRYYMRKARVTNFWEMKDFRDVFHVDKYLLGRNRFSGNISYNFGRVLIADDGHRVKYEYRSALGFLIRYRFWEEFSVNANLYYDFNRAAAARWISDFTYSIGRYQWRPNKLNFGYENYQNNKYTDNAEQLGEKFMEGYCFLSYNIAMPDVLGKLIRIDSTSSLRITPLARFAPRYRDEFEKVHYEGKPTAGVTARWTMFWNLYIEGGAYYYFSPVYRQLPWDPDYTYGFGYFDYRSFRASLTYGNWAVNRWPGKKQELNHYGFLDGNFRFVINWMW